MIGVLIVAGIVFYGVTYSGLMDLQGQKISIMGALTGATPVPKDGATTTTGPVGQDQSSGRTVSHKPLT